jgi:hypothetical protein
MSSACALSTRHKDSQNKEDEVGGACSARGGRENCIENLY